MRIVLFRHGIAHARGAPDCPPDPERALTLKGIERTTLAARGLNALGVEPALILTSPYTRALQTARIAAHELGVRLDHLHECEALLPDAEPKALFTLLAREKAGEILCVGHAPNLDRVLAHAVAAGGAPFTEIKKAGAARVELFVPGHAGGTLVWLLGSKTLRSLASKDP
ncbi:MAG: histidine phosphatase family protein [bacterium]